MKKANTTTKKTAISSKDYSEVLNLKTSKDTIAIIEQWVKKHSGVGITDNTNWFIGITEKEVTTKGLNHLLSHDTKSKDIALAVEKHFHDKGMKIEDFKGGLNSKSRHVYVHKIHKGLLE